MDLIHSRQFFDFLMFTWMPCLCEKQVGACSSPELILDLQRHHLGQVRCYYRQIYDETNSIGSYCFHVVALPYPLSTGRRLHP